jgi:hypothetical protein
MREYLKDIITELKVNMKDTRTRGCIDEFKKSYQPRAN